MDQKHLFGTMTDYVTQPEAEKWKSTCTYEVLGLSFDAKMFALNEKFHARRFVKGKNYTVEDKAMMYQLLSLFAKDPSMSHDLSFAVTIERCKLLKDCAADVIQELQAAHPKNKRYQELGNIHSYVADTKKDTTRDIRDHLRHIYSSNKYKRTIVFTSRLLYRAWSQNKIDSVMFADNFKSISYIVQALGRGLRYDTKRPNKVCRVIMPVDINQTGPWSHFVSLLNKLKDWDFRPIESIMSLINKPRSKAKRKRGSGQVLLNVNGVTVPVNSLIAGLKHHIMYNTDWANWTEWKALAEEYFKKLETVEGYLINSSQSDSRWYKQIYNELCANERHVVLIENNMPSKIKNPHAWLRLTMTHGYFGIKHLPEYVKNNTKNLLQNNRERTFEVLKKYFDEVQVVRRTYPFMTVPKQGRTGYQYKEFMAAVKQIHDTYWSHLKNFFTIKKIEKFIHNIIHGNERVLSFIPNKEQYFKEQISLTKKIINEKRLQRSIEITKLVIQHHEKNFTNLREIKSKMLAKFPELKTPNRWRDWVYSPIIPNQYSARLEELKKTPLVAPGRAKCIVCNSKPVTIQGYISRTLKFSKVCGSNSCMNYYKKNISRGHKKKDNKTALAS